MTQHELSVGARVRADIDVGGVIRPFVPAGRGGRVEALVDGGYLVRFDACHRSMGVHADEIASADESAASEIATADAARR